MAPKKSGVTKVDAPKGHPIERAEVILLGDAVRCWSEVGVTISVTDDPPQFLRATFGHERIAKNSTQAEISRTFRLIDEANEAELEKRIRRYKKMFSTVDPDDDEQIKVERKKGQKKVGKGSARDRAKARMEESGYG